MNHRKQSIIIIISLLTLLSCSKQEDSTDRIIDLTSFRNVEQKFNLIEDYNFPAGLILSIAKVNDEQYMFLDFTQRALFILDTFENEVRQFGSKGDGPGEYRMPIHFRKVEADEIAFTDISNMSIKFTRLDGSFLNRIDHSLGGGKQFLLYEKNIFVLGGSNNPQKNHYQLTILDNMGNIKEELFPVKKEFENQVKNLGMGGITMIEDKVFFMNIIEPVIYVYNVSTGKTSEVTPFNTESDMFTFNDGFSLMHSDSEELRNIYRDGEIVVFQGMSKIEIDGKLYLAVTARKENNRFAYIVDYNSFDLTYEYETSQSIIGIDDQFIYESDTDSGNGIIEKVTFTFNMN